MKITLGVKEHIELEHEIEIEVLENSGTALARVMNHIDKYGTDGVQGFIEDIEGVEFIDSFIEEVPDRDKNSFNTWIKDLEKK